MKKNLPRLILVFLLGLLIIPTNTEAATNSAEDAQAWRRNSPVTSHLKNVVVAGMPKEVALDVAIWSETVIERIQEWAQSGMPGKYAYPLVIRSESRGEESQGFVIASQWLTDDGHVRQRLTVVNPALIDREDVLEGLCHLLLNRWIHARESAEQLAEKPGEFPHWFTYGIAQSLYPDLMDRNYQLLKREEDSGRYLPAMSVASRLVLPPGRWPEKAHAGLVVKWMIEKASSPKILMTAADAIANEEDLSEAFLLNLVNMNDTAVFNASWDLWMAERSKRLVPGLTAANIESLVRILEMHAEDLGLAHPAIPGNGTVPPALLIEERNSKWAKDVCALMIWRLRMESIGKFLTIQEAINPFIEVLDLMLNPPPVVTRKINKKNQVVKSPPSTRELLKKWRKADRQWQKLVQKYSGRSAFLDEYDRARASNTNALHEWLNQWEAENP